MKDSTIKNVIAFGASNSKQSINKQFAEFAATQLTSVESIILDLNDFELPLYSIDLEKKSGIPANALRFSKFIKESDAIIISLAEYNGLHTSAFKNLWDWLSRIPMEKPMNIWDSKPMLLLSTSPSKRPTSNVLKVSNELFPHFGTKIIGDFHLPSFNHFFIKRDIVEPRQKQLFNKELNNFQTYINNN